MMPEPLCVRLPCCGQIISTTVVDVVGQEEIRGRTVEGVVAMIECGDTRHCGIRSLGTPFSNTLI